MSVGGEQRHLTAHFLERRLERGVRWRHVREALSRPFLVMPTPHGRLRHLVAIVAAGRRRWLSVVAERNGPLVTCFWLERQCEREGAGSVAGRLA